MVNPKRSARTDERKKSASHGKGHTERAGLRSIKKSHLNTRKIDWLGARVRKHRETESNLKGKGKFS